ncbi:tegument protein VP22 [Testudinid alphaherpesvirus 3]|uniref:Tegument protein VP22 n=1 Tax=Testudinid alphaherpesvirus 3 TaxID=2560801 RepID=A0A0K1R1F0_9ALPH|nr:tegument protein VP22 [Testudinid alphaherpesvirus 3]AIU39252.1 tegument protein VP22 [Testudinid alphaherpesvirus 3]AIU39362.1 tegument protein VP22 [Testudinid alphaherpesvirus 3]AKI81638.1 tegument protein VP22 [Testudinid alphaherpesvirus 3]AKI81742.1 tegument protein VP22 [Testudinid alphaherpesvirus 3]AKV40723.1 UL49.2 protein [Testudinid alphaherpesvirus 3]
MASRTPREPSKGRRTTCPIPSVRRAARSTPPERKSRPSSSDSDESPVHILRPEEYMTRYCPSGETPTSYVNPPTHRQGLPKPSTAEVQDFDQLAEHINSMALGGTHKFIPSKTPKTEHSQWRTNTVAANRSVYLNAVRSVAATRAGASALLLWEEHKPRNNKELAELLEATRFRVEIDEGVRLFKTAEKLLLQETKVHTEKLGGHCARNLRL